MAETENRNFAFVTGSSSGIGLAVTQEFLSRGWEVTGVARRDSNILNQNYNHINWDLSELASLPGLLNEKLVTRLNNDSLDRVALINNAGTSGSLVTMEKMEAEELEKIFVLNTIVPIRIIGFFLENCKAGINLNILNLSSAAAHSPLAGLGAYCSSKAALKMASEIFSLETGSSVSKNKFKNLSFISYEPGTVDTEMQREARSQDEVDFPSLEMFKSFHDNNLLVPPDQVAIDISDIVSNDWDESFVEKRFGD